MGLGDILPSRPPAAMSANPSHLSRPGFRMWRLPLPSKSLHERKASNGFVYIIRSLVQHARAPVPRQSLAPGALLVYPPQAGGYAAARARCQAPAAAAAPVPGQRLVGRAGSLPRYRQRPGRLDPTAAGRWPARGQAVRSCPAGRPDAGVPEDQRPARSGTLASSRLAALLNLCQSLGHFRARALLIATRMGLTGTV